MVSRRMRLLAEWAVVVLAGAAVTVAVLFLYNVHRGPSSGQLDEMIRLLRAICVHFHAMCGR